MSTNSKSRKLIPPNDAATAAEPAADPVAVAAAAKLPAPTAGMRLPRVGARAPIPCAIAGAASPVEKLQLTSHSKQVSPTIQTCFVNYNFLLRNK